MEHKDLEIQLIKTCNRLAKYIEDWYVKNELCFVKLMTKIENKKVDELNKKEKVLLSELFDKKYYEGKLAAYQYVLQELNVLFGGKSYLLRINKAMRHFISRLKF